MLRIRTERYVIDLRWWLLALVLAAIACGLGFWQLGRGQQKAALQDAFYDRISMRPLACAEAVREARPAFVRIRLEGRFDPRREFLLDNRTHRAVAGYEVITPFTCRDGTRLLVDRGWIPAGEDRDRIPGWATPAGDVQLSGFIYVPTGLPPLVGDDAWPAQWPATGAKRIGYLDAARMQAESSPRPYRYPVFIDTPGPGVFEPNYTSEAVAPTKHWGYAVQWFAIAIAILAYLGYRSVSRR